MQKKVFVKKDVCVGCGICTNISDLFIIDDDGLAKTTQEHIDDELINSAEQAAFSCPVNAIEVEK